MFPSNIAVNNAAAVSRTFVLVSTGAANSIRVDNATSATAPRRMLISHANSVPKNTGIAVDRRLLSFQHTKINAQGKPLQIIGNWSFQVPRDSIFVPSDINDMVAFARNFLGVQANVDSLMLGEY